MAVESGKTVVLAALGRPFSLGMLYDCRNDSLIPALTLWDREALEKDAVERPQPNSDFEIVASDSIEDKSSALNVEASLKASFLCGLVEIEGSAKFLSDSKTSRIQAGVPLKYNKTTKFHQLSMNPIDGGQAGQATHIVTEILYGAFFVFDCEVSEKEDLKSIEGNPKEKMKKMECQDSLKEYTDIANVAKFSCVFHKNSYLEKHHVSFQEAIEVYQSLPKLLGTNGQNAVPQKVWLMPLKALDSAAAQLVRQISDRLVRDAQNVLEDLSELERRCNDAEKCTTTKQFPQIHKKVTTLKRLLSRYKSKWQTMVDECQSSQGGVEKEGVLVKILKNVHSTPDLHELIDCQESEIQTIRSLIDEMPNMTIVTSRSTLHREIYRRDVRHTVCFVFTSLETPEPYLSALSNYFEETQPDNVSCAYDVEKEQWFFSNDVMDKVQEKVKLFKDFAEANKENKSIRFLTAAISNDVKKGATVHLYKDGSSVTDNFEPPSKPEMITGDITHSSVTLNISPPRFGLATVTHYTVEVCVHGDDVWRQQMESEAGDVTVSGLQINETYQFRCRAMCAVGLGPACEASALIKTLPSSPPEKLQVECYSTELSVSWEKPSELGCGVQIEHYILEYVEKSPGVKPEECIWSKLTFTANESQRVTVIPGLQPSTRYTVRVRCDCGLAGLGKEKSVVVCTDNQSESLPKRLAEVVKKEGSKIKGHPGALDVYTLRLKVHPMNVDGCKCFIFGEDSFKKNRTIMVLGATGVGKSTLVNRMINYILGVTWEDTFRFKLVDEGTAKSQAHSQTSEVTVYKLNHREGFQIDYSLTIVDTPGFGDTRGIERDRMIISQLEKLFSTKLGVSEIDAICLVAQASLARLTPTQKCIFDSVLSIFGKDVAENIRILVTFSDVTKPPVLEAINESGVPCPKRKDGLPIHFKFNNSGKKVPGVNNEDGDSDDDEDEAGNIQKIFWDRGSKSMKKMFSALNAMNTKSLTLTREVLRQRAQLEISIENLNIKVKFGLAKLEEIEQESQILQEQEKNIKSNEAFEYEVEVTKPVKVNANESSLNCNKCKVTCHKSCGVPFGLLTWCCEVFTWSLYCTECEGKCHRSEHVLESSSWGYETVKEKQTYKEMKEKYEKASKEAMSVEDIIKQMRQEYDRLQEEVVRLMECSTQCLNTMKEIALKPNPLSTPEYIDLLIEGEKSEAKLGYLQRIKKLQDMREKEVTMEKVASGAKQP